jgi:hypothetical protein
MGEHPVAQAFEHQRVAAARTEIFAVGVQLSPVEPNPWRQIERIGSLFRPQLLEVLVIADQLVKRAARNDLSRIQLSFE